MAPATDLPAGPEARDLPRPAPPRSWRERIEELADATGTSPVRLAVGAAAVVAAAIVGLWWTRAPAQPPEVTLPFASTTLAVPAPSTSDVPTVLVVHVAGAVVRPGVVELPPGARVVDAVEAAGGMLPEADGARINLAARLSDGERVYIPAVGEVVALPLDGAGDAAPGGARTSGPLDLNTADAAALDALPGVGPATAAAIIDHRSKIGRFTSVDQLLDVRGIGAAKLEQLRPLVTV